MSTIGRVLEDLWWLAEHHDDLLEAKIKGTPRPWQESHAEVDVEAAIAERKDRSELAPGEHPAPLHLDTLDLLVDLLATADDLAEQIAQAAGVARMPPAPSAFADPAPYLRHCAAWLKPATEADSGLLDAVEVEVSRLRSLVAAKLGFTVDGQRVPGLCPWCSGGPTQQQTLRIRLVKPGPDLPPVAAAVCESGVCEPPPADVGVWAGTRPAWPIDTEGKWLSDRIAHKAKNGPRCSALKPTDEDPDATCDEPLLPTGKGGQERRYCSAACRRAVDAARRRAERETAQEAC